MNGRHRKNRILVVEDHPLAAKMVARLLVHQGLATVLAYNGNEAMDRLTAEEFDAVISDVQMPGMGGFELLQNIHVRFPQLPVILMTAFVEEGMRDAALAWGAITLLQKPFSRQQLVGALAVALRGDDGEVVRQPEAVAPREEAVWT